MTVEIKARESAVFSNWIPFRRQIEEIGLAQKNNVILDLSDTRLVDHSVMEKLHEMEQQFHQEGLKLRICGLDNHRGLSKHKLAAQRRSKASDVDLDNSFRPNRNEVAP